MDNSIIYIRVSTDKQVEEGNSLETQEKICKEFSERNGYKLVVKPFIEEGESAKTTKRSKLIEMMEYCRKNKGKIDLLIIYKVNRFARNTNDYLALKLYFNRLGIKIVSCTESLDDSPSGRFSETILAAQAQYDNEVRGEVCKGGSIGLVQKGMRNGKPPVGLTKVGEGRDRMIVREEPQASLISKAFELLSTQAYSEMDVYKIISREGFYHCKGKEITFSYFDKIIRNPIYKGFLVDYNQNIESHLIEKVTSPEQFDKVQIFLHGKKKKMPKYIKNNPEFPLRGLLCCRCGAKISASNNRGRSGGIYPNYSKRCKCEFDSKVLSKNNIHKNFVEYLNHYEYDANLIDVLKKSILENWKSKNIFVINEIKFLDKEITNLREKSQDIADKMLHYPNQESFWSDKLDQTIQLQKEKTEKRNGIKKPEETSEEVIDFGLKFISDLSKHWESQNNIEIKQRFQNFFFPEGVTVFQDGKFGTNVLPLCVRIKTLYTNKDSTLVARMGVEPMVF